MPNLNFDMSTLGGHHYKESNFEKEEDFSVCLITFVKDHPAVTILPNKQQKHPYLESIDKFYGVMSDSKGEELIDMLSREDGATALEILDKLPLVRKMTDKIKKVSFKDPN